MNEQDEERQASAGQVERPVRPLVPKRKELTMKMNIGGRYNWKGQPERLVYLGDNLSGNGYWHQFAKVETPTVVWCEVKGYQLEQFEETACGCAQGTCESKSTGCRMAAEVARRDPAVM